MIKYYNPKNIEYARFNRNQYNMTEAEWKIWNQVLRKKQTWYRFLRQKPIWNYIIDFYCPKLNLWIEIDDLSHNFKWDYDHKRTKYLNKLWIKIIRYSNESVHYNLDWIMLDLANKLEDRSKELSK